MHFEILNIKNINRVKNVCKKRIIYIYIHIRENYTGELSLQKNLHLETDNSVSNPSRNRITDGLETEFSVLKTLVCDFDRL